MSASTLLSGPSPLLASLTPKPLAYKVFPPWTTATAMPGMPVPFIRSSTSPSSLAIASSMRPAGMSRPDTSLGGASDNARRRAGYRLPDAHAVNGQQHRDDAAVAARLVMAERRRQAAPLSQAERGNQSDSRHHASNPPGVAGSIRCPGTGTATGRWSVGGREQPLDGLGPRVRRQPERAPVDRHQQTRPRVGDVQVRADRFLGVHVDVRPRRVVGADRHQRQVERPVVGADLREALGVAGVAAEVRAVRRADERPRRPQRGVAGAGSGRRSAAPACRSAVSSPTWRSGSSRVRRCGRSGCPTRAGARRHRAARRTGRAGCAPARGRCRCRGGRSGRG